MADLHCVKLAIFFTLYCFFIDRGRELPYAGGAA